MSMDIFAFTSLLLVGQVAWTFFGPPPISPPAPSPDITQKEAGIPL